MCILAPIEVPKVLAHIAENDHLLNLDGFGPFDLTVLGDFQMAMKRGFVRVALMLCVDTFGIFINFVLEDIRLLCLGDRQDEVYRLFVEFEFARFVSGRIKMYRLWSNQSVPPGRARFNSSAFGFQVLFFSLLDYSFDARGRIELCGSATRAPRRPWIAKRIRSRSGFCRVGIFLFG